MPSRRQEKVAQLITEVVSDIIAHRLSDPRIEGLVSITQVTLSADLRNAEICVSIMADNEAAAKKTFNGIEHATRHIQALLGERMTSKFCPRLRFRQDKNFKNTLETLRIIDEVSRQFSHDDDTCPGGSNPQ